ncbi:beta-lactamase superfamily hydrolase [Lactobacillus selangorensis]|uniref:Ribonuclease Z n=1 Tax=Lactobacillus selangorensis TaxID=81857 RepID=A0A0R2FWU5_9LACO|nr:ribonuclease Z [Lactobacillus selangorensis]KRN29421.1 beta-lactamase superfamily hydrolase [Lactobacillus selangorensis]KRN34050.1 beta-lactamase superfamily hydrolase [Lactobacillus selangorensis]
MELEFLGTGAGVPAKNRNVTSIALKLLNERNEIWLFDAGEGTQQQILRTTIKPRKITKIFITHLHGDHLYGLPGLLSSRSFQGGNTPLTIYGPQGVDTYVRTSLRVSDSHLTYPIHYVILKNPGKLFEDNTFKVEVAKLDHRIPSFGYRIIEKDHAGELLVDKLRADGVPSGPIYGQLKAGQDVTLPDGRLIHGKDYVGPAQKGRIVTILGDTRKNKNGLKLAQNADVLVHESTFGDEEKKLAHQYYHSTSTEAADIAKKAHVGELLLTHISARYVGKMSQQLEREARQIFPHTRVMNDFDTYTIPLRSGKDA